MRKQLAISISILLLIIAGTAVAILYGRGYRFGIESGRPGFSGTGLLVATSLPDGAEVLIDDHLTTATNNTINLFPGEYKVKIFKEGYFPWEKKIKIQKEVVSKADAVLFPTTPKLEGITLSGVESLAIDPSLTQIAYTISSQSARKNGVYVMDMSNKPILTLRSASTQIADDTVDNFSKAKLSWAPDGKEILALISQEDSKTGIPINYLLSTSSLNENPKDVTTTLTTVEIQWEKDKEEKQKAIISGLKSELAKVIRSNFQIMAWSYDETKILYEASKSAELPVIIKPRLIGTNSTDEDRNLKENSVYVYDIKEDKNYKIMDSLGDEELLTWFPDSKHLIFVHEKKIDIMDFDGLNTTTVYAGPFIDKYVYPWPNGSKIVILTSLGNTNIPPNIYTIGLK